ncbi:ankyrin repeat-containing domain protein [Lentinula edodes]|nr:ankyrin repeat-containing domain protein [Lentinula edodes]
MTSVYSSTLSSDNFGLQFWALGGDDEGVQDAINAGANINATDASGRTALMCAVAGKHWSNISFAHDESFMTSSRLKVVDILLRRPEVSLSTLNAPQDAYNDATPLGMAAWLNIPAAVRVLLRSSLDCVAVDGTDMHGSTPLMYAARDGHVDIVKLLLQHGARPDLRALNHRSAIQYAISHPQVLYLCETMLRQHRLHEWKFTNKNGSPTDSDDLFERVASSLAFIPTFDNFPQPLEGTSHSKTTDTILQCLRSNPQELCSTLFPAHTTQTSFLPPLVNNRDGNGWSPIHHCASASEPSVRVLDTLYCAGADVALFTEHEHYTALHCFAFSDHATYAFDELYQYVYHLVHDLRAPLSARDKQGNTCIHIAAEHGYSIEVLRALLKCDSSYFVRDLCNAKGLTAWEVAKPQYRTAFSDTNLSRPGSSLSTNTLRPAHYSIESYMEPESIADRKHASGLPTSKLDIFSTATRLIDNLRISSPSIHHDFDIRHTEHLESLVIEMEQLQRTIIDHFQVRMQQVSDVLKEMEDDAQETAVLLESVAHSVDAKLQERGLQPWTRIRMSEDSEITCVSDRFSNSRGLKTKSSLSIPKSLESTASSANGSSTASAEKKAAPSTTSRFVAWIKRKTSANALAKVSNPSPTLLQKDAPKQTFTDREESDLDMMRTSIESALRTSVFPLRAAGRDLESLRESIASARKLLRSAAQSISRADRVLSRALKTRRAMIGTLRKEDDLFIHSNSLSNKSSLASIASISTIASQVSAGNTSFSGILAESDDEETRAIRRLLLRKIDARHNGVLDEIEKTRRWLLVIKDIVQGVKRRTYV